VLKNITFTLAGFINPERRKLRQLGEKLGGLYKGSITRDL